MKKTFEVSLSKDAERLLKSFSTDYCQFFQKAMISKTLNKNFFNFNLFFYPHYASVKKTRDAYKVTVLNGSDKKDIIYSKEEYIEKIMKPSNIFCNIDYTKFVCEEEQMERLTGFLKDTLGEDSIKVVEA